MHCSLRRIIGDHSTEVNNEVERLKGSTGNFAEFSAKGKDREDRLAQVAQKFQEKEGRVNQRKSTVAGVKDTIGKKREETKQKAVELGSTFQTKDAEKRKTIEDNQREKEERDRRFEEEVKKRDTEIERLLEERQKMKKRLNEARKDKNNLVDALDESLDRRLHVNLDIEKSNKEIQSLKNPGYNAEELKNETKQKQFFEEREKTLKDSVAAKKKELDTLTADEKKLQKALDVLQDDKEVKSDIKKDRDALKGAYDGHLQSQKELYEENVELIDELKKLDIDVIELKGIVELL